MIMNDNTNKIAILIKKLSLEIDKLSNPILEPHGLTHSQFKILKFLLVNSEKHVRQVDIEKYFSMTNPTVTGLVQNLEKKGLIERKVNPDDSRSKILCPTEKTFAMKNLLYQLGDQLEDTLTSGLTSSERETLLGLLKKLLHNSKDAK